MTEKKYPIGGYAPGNYECHCCKCGVKFSGDKRAVEYEPCAVKDKEHFDSLPEEEQIELRKRNADIAKELFDKIVNKNNSNE